MVTIYNIDKNVKENKKQTIYAELRGLSTDTKPTVIGQAYIGNGSVFIEMDTQKVFFYNATDNTWEG